MIVLFMEAQGGIAKAQSKTFPNREAALEWVRATVEAELAGQAPPRWDFQLRQLGALDFALAA